MTLTEKMSLLMLCEIYEHLGVDGEFEADFIRSAIHGGHLWALNWSFGGLAEPDVDDTVASEVGRIMDMWSFIEYSHGELDAAGQADLAAKSPVWGTDPRFRGFDGNHETEYMSTAQFMVEKMKRFTEFAGRGFNSHSPEVDMSRRMLAVFHEMRTHSGDGLRVDQLASVLNARSA